MTSTYITPSVTTDRHPSSSREKFPELEIPTDPPHQVSPYGTQDSHAAITSGRTPSPNKANGSIQPNAWQPRKDPHLTWSNGHLDTIDLRPSERRKSLSEAFNKIRSRRASVGENAQEIAAALKAPLSPKLVTLCLMWYLSSALTSTSSKSILTAFPKPITLTLLQFALISFFCLLAARLAQSFPELRRAVPALRNGVVPPSRAVVQQTLPLALFQIIGHILSSTATEKIPVSLVHTIKGLSPLFTVLAYRLLFDIRYGTSTYIALVPLTFGVILSCSIEFSGNLFGVLCAFGSTVVFVSQNLFSKKLFNEAARAESDGPSAASPRRNLDKLNLLCYSAGLAFLLTFPIWLWTDALPLYSSPLSLTTHDSSSPLRHSSMYLPLEFFFNGLSHFAQNFLAFILLSMTSPVTYSVASQIKRVFVIVMAILWFGNSTTTLQAVGIALTFFGLYLYDRANETSKADRRARSDDSQSRREKPLLPLVSSDAGRYAPTFVNDSPPSTATTFSPPPLMAQPPATGQYMGNLGSMFGYTNGHVIGDEKKADAAGPGRPRSESNGGTPAAFLPGTKQEDTWR